jgi:hypothetical protein
MAEEKKMNYIEKLEAARQIALAIVIFCGCMLALCLAIKFC